MERKVLVNEIGLDEDEVPEEPRTKPLEEYSPREIGREGERLAAEYLTRRGMEVIERNWRCAMGEADLICLEDDMVVLVEVKTRLRLGEGGDEVPELAVDHEKRNRYRRIALFYLAMHPNIFSVRFDVIALNIVAEHAAHLRHLVGAYEVEE